MSKKILFLSCKTPDDYNDTGNGCRREFLSNGVDFLDYNEVYPAYGYSGSQVFIKDYISKNGIEILIFWGEGPTFHFPLDFFSGLRKRIFTVMLSGETAYFFDVRDKYYAAAMDLFVVLDSVEAVHVFREFGGDALFFAGPWDRKKYFKLNHIKKNIDVSFVGSVAGKKDRVAYIDYLGRNGVDVQIFGDGTPGGRVTHDRMVEIFNTTRINLNFAGASAPSHLISPDMTFCKKQIKGRLAEVALCGSFVLTENTPGIGQILSPDEEMVVFSDQEDLLKKVKFYLLNEHARETIAERGYRRAIKDYDLRLAIPRLLAEIEVRRLSGKRVFAAICPDAAFERNFASYRMLYIIKFFKQFRLAFALEELLLICRIKKLNFSHLYTFAVEEVVDKFPKLKKIIKNLLFIRPR